MRLQRPLWLGFVGLLLLACSLVNRFAPAPSTPAPPPPTVARSTPPPAGSPHRPFPQHVAYPPGTILPNHLAQAALDQTVRDLYNAWIAAYLWSDCGAGQSYVHTASATGGGADSISISEGHGYGMLLTALMAGHDPRAQEYFDRLYAFFRAHPSVNSPDLMAWNQVAGCGDVEPGQTDSALDGDLDIAYALLLADAQWGSAGAIDYRGAALNVINAILQHEVNPETMTLTLGDWVTADDSGTYYATRSSDFMFAHLRAFQAATGDARWGDVLEATYALVAAIQAGHSPDTGLLPDFIVNVNTSPRPADPDFLEGPHDGHFDYNACRTPWRLGLDYLLSGDPRSREALEPINRWIQSATGGDPALIYAGYDLDGRSDDERAYSDLAFVAPLGVAAMLTADNQAWLNRLWDFTIAPATEAGGYYDNTLRLLALIVMSGNWWQP